MAEHALASPSSNIAIARSVFNKITETVDNFNLHALPLLSLSEQWKGLRSSLAIVMASMEGRANKLETDEKRIESMLREIRVMEEKLKVEERSLSEKAKKMEVREESVNKCWEVTSKEIEERLIELRNREGDYEERFKLLEFDEKFVDDVLDVKEKGIRKLGEALELRESGLSDELRGFEARKREIEEECRCLETREKEMKEEIEVFESKKKGLVEEFRELEEKKRRVEESRRGLEVREKEIEERSRVQELRGKEMKELGEELEMRAKEIVEGRRVLEEKRKVVDLREKKIKARENDLNLKEKELIEFELKLELKEKGIDKGFQACCDDLNLKKDQLVESHRVLGLKESEIVEKCKEVELTQERMNEQWRVLEVKEKEISCRLRAVELKEKEMNDKRVMRVNEDVDDHRQLSVVAKEELVGEPLNMLDFEEERVSGTCRGANFKGVLIKKCSNLPKQENEVLKQQYSEGKIVEDGCNVAGVKEVISENPQAENLAVTSVVASTVFAEIQLVFKNDDARDTASYLTEHAETVSMWQKNRLALKEEILGLLESLTAEHKHLQAAMCTCIFEMKDVYPPDFLLEAHLEHVRQRAKEIVQKGGETAQDDAANMELGALRNVLQCTSNFKLESIYPPAPCELRITQLKKEMEIRRKPTKSQLKKKSSCDLGTKLKASDSTKQTKTSPSPNLSAAISDSQPKNKRRASSSSSIKQNKRHRYHL